MPPLAGHYDQGLNFAGFGGSEGGHCVALAEHWLVAIKDQGSPFRPTKFSVSIFCRDTALCVRQCNYKISKVPKSKTLLRLNFSSEIIQTFFK